MGRFASADPWFGEPQAPMSLHQYLYSNHSGGQTLTYVESTLNQSMGVMVVRSGNLISSMRDVTLTDLDTKSSSVAADKLAYQDPPDFRIDLEVNSSAVLLNGPLVVPGISFSDGTLRSGGADAWYSPLYIQWSAPIRASTKILLPE